MFKKKPNYFFDVCWAIEMNFRKQTHCSKENKPSIFTPKYRIKLNPEVFWLLVVIWDCRCQYCLGGVAFWIYLFICKYI